MPPASLVTMPNEILLMICENLCSHCLTFPSGWNINESTLSFSSLIRTCRRLRDIAQPLQYHEVSPTDFRLLLRTIIARPDLAAQVRRFCPLEVFCSAPLAEDMEMLRAEARRHDIGKCDEWLQTMKDYEYDCQLRLLELTLARLPSVETLFIEEPFFYQTRLNVSLEALVSMPSVSDMQLYLCENNDLGRMCSFLSMMPCLEKLEVQMCGSISRRLPLSALRSLIISASYISAASLQNLVNSCPQLEHFEYAEGDLGAYAEEDSQIDLEMFTWGQAQRILHTRRKTLKTLNFEFGSDCLLGRYEPLGPEDYLSSFHDFDKVETLWVRTTSFGTEDDAEVIPSFPEDVQDLVKRLPASLICLGFCGSHKGWNGVKTLAEAIQRGHFQQLKKVMLEQGQTEFEESCEILAACGVVSGRLTKGSYGSFPHGKDYVE